MYIYMYYEYFYRECKRKFFYNEYIIQQKCRKV